MRTIEEAIQHCNDVAKTACPSCADEHRQLSEWLSELSTYRTAEEQGLLNIWPCKPGDIVYADKRIFEKYSVYRVHEKHVRCEAKIIKITKRGYFVSLHPLTERTASSNYHKFVSFGAFGKTVFLTREEAEKKLEEGKGK